MIKTVIFDMDGVILDSELIYLSSLSKCLKTLTGKQYSVQELSDLIGMSMEDITSTLIKRYDIDMGMQELIALQDQFYDIEVEERGIAPMPGLLDFLQYLKQKEVSLVLASSSDRGWIGKVLEETGTMRYFDVVLSCDDVKHAKPDPEILLLAAKRCYSKESECIVIEDSQNGILAGKRAGMKVVAYKGSSIRQNTSLADYEAMSFFEMHSLFEKLFIGEE